MPKPKKVKATGFKKSGYSNTSKSNNTSYVSSKDKLYSKGSYLIYSLLTSTNYVAVLSLILID